MSTFFYTASSEPGEVVWFSTSDFGKWSYYGTEPPVCKHEVIDNGTRLSECRHCKVTMRLRGFEWSAE